MLSNPKPFTLRNNNFASDFRTRICIMVFTFEADNVSCHNNAAQIKKKPNKTNKKHTPNNTTPKQNILMIGLIKICGHF